MKTGHVSVMTSNGSVWPLDLCLRLRHLCVREEGAGQGERVLVLTERERRSVKGYFGVGTSGGILRAHSCECVRSLSVSWRHLSKQPAVNV